MSKCSGEHRVRGSNGAEPPAVDGEPTSGGGWLRALANEKQLPVGRRFFEVQARWGPVPPPPPLGQDGLDLNADVDRHGPHGHACGHIATVIRVFRGERGIGVGLRGQQTYRHGTVSGRGDPAPRYSAAPCPSVGQRIGTAEQCKGCVRGCGGRTTPGCLWATLGAQEVVRADPPVSYAARRYLSGFGERCVLYVQCLMTHFSLAVQPSSDDPTALDCMMLLGGFFAGSCRQRDGPGGRAPPEIAVRHVTFWVSGEGIPFEPLEKGE